jgi:tetratricopeptide (TPR) repeat protein
MSRAHRFFIDGDYQNALAILKKEAERDSQDDLQGGAVCEVGAILICLGRYEEAIEHFNRLIEKSMYRVSMHRTYMGVAYWFGRKRKRAIAQWEEARQRSQYNQYHGFDVPFILYFVATTSPKHYSLDDAKRFLRPLYDEYKMVEDFETHTAAYLLDLMDDDAYAKALLTITTGKRIRERIALNRALLSFYRACKSAERRDKASYRLLMADCATARGHDELLPELVIAKCEIASWAH